MSFSFSCENAFSIRIYSIKGFRDILTINVSVFYIQYLLKWTPAELYYQIKSLWMKGERERSFLGFVQIFILGKLTITKVLFEGSKWEDFLCENWM